MYIKENNKAALFIKLFSQAEEEARDCFFEI